MKPAAIGRRIRFGLLTATLLGAVAASTVLANVLASRYRLRIDVTQTGEHRLSPRTRAILDRAGGEWEIVIAADLAATDPAGRPVIDPRARRRAENVLAEMQRLHPSLRVTWIDTSTPAGHHRLQDLLDRLLQRDRDAIERQLADIRAGADDLEQAADFIEHTLGPALVRLAASLPAAGPFDSERAQWERLGRTTSPAEAAMIRRVADAVRSTLPESDALTGWPLPDLDAALSSLAPELRRTTRTLEVMHAFAGDVRARDDLPDETRAQAATLQQLIAQRRDALAVRSDAVARLRSPDLLRVARAIQAQDAAIVIGPPGVGLTAIDVPALFPPASVIDQSEGMQSNLGLRAEELIATAISSLTNPLKPIVVLLHAEDARLLDRWDLFGLAVQRLQLRGMDVVEWPVVLEPEAPSLAALDPDGSRPVVYLCHNTYASLLGGEGARKTGRDRAMLLGQTLAHLAENGQALFLSLAPSPLPGLGIPDPTASFLEEAGVKALTGTPLLQQTTGAAGRSVSPDFLVRVGQPADPITGALVGLDTALPWPCPLVLPDPPPPGVRITPLLTVRQPQAWSETQWETFYNTPRAYRDALSNPPVFDRDRDQRADAWVVAAAIERDHDAGPQRLIVVGSNGWFTTGIVGLQRTIDGRAAPLYPGNAELLEAGVYWLAGQDDMIHPTAIARAVPRVRDLSPDQIEAMRWLVMAGLPAAVLVLGLVWRIVRG